MGDVFLEFHTEIFEARIMCYVNGVLFKRVKEYLNDKYLWGTTPVDIKIRYLYYYKCIMIRRHE